MAIESIGASAGVDIRVQASDALSGAATVVEQKLRDLAKSVQEANNTISKIAKYYASANAIISGTSFETDSSNVREAINYLNQNGYRYTLLDGPNPLTENDKATILSDLLTLKDNATSISQKTFSDFQRATEQLQTLQMEQGTLEKSLADKLADVIRNWS